MEAHRTVTREELDTYTKKCRAPEDGKSVVETPENDIKAVEGLLNLPPGSFGKSFITISGDLKACPNCNRNTSFLDILSDGAAFHGNDFIKGVIQGERGCVYNPNSPRPHKCYECKVPSPVITPGYGCGGYACGPGPPG